MSRSGIIIDFNALTPAARVVIAGAQSSDLAVIIIDEGPCDRAGTERSLAERDIVYDMLITRKPGDESPGSVFKLTSYEDEISDSYKVELVVEGNGSAFLGWLSIGLEALYSLDWLGR